MKLGTQYYRDPNPPERFWKKDLADLAAAGFAFIGCWIPWRYVNPERDRWELAKYRRLLDCAHARRLAVRIQLVPESAPDWVVREHPDTLLVNERGQPVPLYPHSMLQLGGWPGLNGWHPVARRLIDDYYQQVVRRLKDHPAILTWNVWNEIQVPVVSHDPWTTAAYRQWAARTYGGLRGFNAAHHTCFRSFEELRMPNPALRDVLVLADAADLQEFLRWASIREARHRAACVRAVDRRRPLSLHTNANSPYAVNRDEWDIADAVDIYGNSTYNLDPFHDTLSAIKQRSVKGPGRWWLTEHCGGRMIFYYGHQTFTGRDLVSDALKALAHGATRASFWQYRNERLGQEAPNFGLLNHDGSPSERLAALTQFARALNRWPARALRHDPARIGVLAELLDHTFRTASDSWMNQPWQEFNEFEQWLRALLDLGHSPGFLLAHRLAARGLPRALKIVIAPSLVVLRPGVARRLTQWVRAGGHLLAGPFTGVFDPQGWTFPRAPGDGLATLFGVHVVRRRSAERFSFVEPHTRTERLAGRILFEELKLRRGARVELTCDGQPAVVTHRLGRGTATYLAAFAGAEQAAGSNRLVTWLGDFLRARGVRPPVEFRGPVWLNAARLRRRRVLFVHNPTKADCTATLRVGAAAKIVDPIDGDRLAVADGEVALPLAPRQVRVLTW